ncbi:MAG: hypothetical protein ABI604_12155 [Nitrospirota bacterium]
MSTQRAGSAQLHRSLSYEQGSGTRGPRLFTKQTKMRVDCVHSPPLGAGNEGENQSPVAPVFSKCIRLNQLTRTVIMSVQIMLNDRPRNVINWHSPAHVAYHLLL